MPTNIVAENLTALEAVKRMNQPWPGRIIECITKVNEILLDLTAVAANDGMEHVIVRRQSLAGASIRNYYEGTPTATSQTKTLREPVAMWQKDNVVDADLADHNGADAFRKTESIATINALGIDQATDFIYGNRSVNHKGIDGFATRLNKLDNVNVYDFGGTGNVTSLYLIANGDRFVHTIYPSTFGTVGIKHTDDGKHTVKDENGGDYEIYRDWFKLQYGLAIEDPRAVIRLANIPTTIGTAAGQLDPYALVRKILSLRWKMPGGASSYSLYGNDTVQEALDIATFEKGNVNYVVSDPWGNPVKMLRDIRCRRVQAILDTETVIA